MVKRIALIDDDPDILGLFAEILDQNGYTVSTFTDPLEALSDLQTNIREYDLIISDYKMPCLSVNSLCQKLIAINPELKVIIMSAYTNIDCDRTFTFVSKPLTVSKLLQVVTENLGQKIIS